MPASGLSDAEVAQFAELVRGLPRLAILVAQVDPDGVGSALGLAAIARSLGVEADVFYAGSFGHPQSIMLWEAFGLEARIRPIRERDPMTPTALVDSSKVRDARFGAVALDPVVIVDHHGNARDIGAGRFHYVVPGGAASSLVADIGFRLGLQFDEDTSTLLALGILTDAEGLAYVGTRPIDRHMYARLMDAGDQELVYRVSRFPMTERACSIVQRMLTHRAMHPGSILVSHMPDILDATEGEYLALAADILVRHADARLVLALGIVDGVVRVSARTREPSLPLPAILRHLFGPDSGAKECSGGARMELPSSVRDDRRLLGRFHLYQDRLRAQLAELDLPTVP